MRLTEFGLPKMAVGKGVTGTAFKVTFKMLRLFKSLECYINFQHPWRKLRGVITSACIVFGDALLQVGGVSNVTILGMTDALNDAGVKN